MINLKTGKAICPVCDVKQSISSVSGKLTTLGRVAHSEGGGGWGALPHPAIFFGTPPHQNRCPLHGPRPPIKNEAPPSEKQTPPLKSEATSSMK